MCRKLYYKSVNFCENFNFTNSVKRHFCGAKNSRLVHDLPISVIDSVISPFREDFIFTKITPSRKFPNLQFYASLNTKLCLKLHLSFNPKNNNSKISSKIIIIDI